MKAHAALVASLMLATTTACGGSGSEASSPQGTPQSGILSAFFGLDNELPALAGVLCPDAPGKDGMPLVFHQEVSDDSIDPDDFTITTDGGRESTPGCATLGPAFEEDEDRTILLIGNFGNAETDPPASAAVVGDLWSESGHNWSGAMTTVTPLTAGPSLVYAEGVDPVDHDCPAGSERAVMAIWDGGVKNVSNETFARPDFVRFRMHFANGATEFHRPPTAMTDLADQDNVLVLCTEQSLAPASISVSANTAIDPNGDPNDETEVSISQ